MKPPRKTGNFRSKYLTHAELTQQLQDWAKAFPQFVRVESIGKSREGRDLWLLTLGVAAERKGPAVWIDGNMHAGEVCGSSVALAFAEDIIQIHQGKKVGTLAPHTREFLKGNLFYILPRMSPDGAEAVLQSGRYARSTPHDDREAKGHPYWQWSDVNEDGSISLMRKQDPDGEVAECDGIPGLLVPRTVEHAGPFYRTYPEGTIANFDGHRIPDPLFISDNPNDFNRNFPFTWIPEREQLGAGNFPGSNPETLAVIEFAIRHPNIFVWLNLHTFGGVFIRPLGGAPDAKMDQVDLEVFRQIEEWNLRYTGYRTVSGFQEFLYEPEKPLHGDLVDYAYHQRGCISYVCELWDLFKRIGLAPKKPFVDSYFQWSESDTKALHKWDRKENKSRVFKPWKKFRHPQIGDVEIGGYDGRVGVSNPPYEKLDEVCRAQSEAFLRVASLLPRVSLKTEKIEKLADKCSRITLKIKNSGYLATHGLPSAKELPHSETLKLTFEASGLKMLSPSKTVVDLGHLEGWGQGLHPSFSPLLPWTRGNANEQIVDIVVQGTGSLQVKVSSCRVGVLAETIRV